MTATRTTADRLALVLILVAVWHAVTALIALAGGQPHTGLVVMAAGVNAVAAWQVQIRTRRYPAYVWLAAAATALATIGWLAA